MSAFTKHILAGSLYTSYDNSTLPVYVTIRFSEDGRLSITGVVRPTTSGDADSCGQITDTLLDQNFRNADGIDCIRLAEIWDRWHLNDMVAETPRQMAYLRRNPVNVTYPQSHYDESCKVLAAAGLHPDPETNYRYRSAWLRYRSAWLREEVPQDVLTWLQSLPETDNLPSCWKR